MKLHQWILLFFTAVMYGGFAQDTLQNPAISSSEQQKNIDLYKSIEKKSQNKKITRELHKLLFHSLNTDNNHSQTQKVEQSLRRNFKQVQGKIIRNIYIETLDPLGFSVEDASKTPNKYERLGNVFHNKTKKSVVEKWLLFKENQPLDSVLVKESERLLREQSFIRSALIMPEFLEETNQVNLHIRVLDTWTMVGDMDGSTKHFTLRGKEYNFLGLGHELALQYRQEIQTQKRISGSFSYTIPNLFASRIVSWVLYDYDFDNYYTKQIGIGRTYFSPLTRWAGGIAFTERSFRDELYHNDSLYLRDFKTITRDAWGSVAFPILKKYTAQGSVTNLTLSARFYNLDYKRKTEYALDSINFFSDKRDYLFSVGISNIGYEQDRYVFKHNEIEDIPVGKTFSFIAGAENNDNQTRSYFGLRVMYGSYWSVGYVSADIQAGSYFYGEDEKQTTLKIEANYFSKMKHLGSWNMRQFIKFRSVVGFSRKNHIKDRISLNGDTGMDGFYSPILLGTRKHILTLQTQFYTPFLWKGFRVSPFLISEMGSIGQMNTSFFTDVFIPKLGVGFYVTNDYIRFGKFQFSFFYLPRVPGVGHHIHKLSGTNNYDFSLPNFSFKSPAPVRYQ